MLMETAQQTIQLIPVPNLMAMLAAGVYTVGIILVGVMLGRAQRIKG